MLKELVYKFAYFFIDFPRKVKICMLKKLGLELGKNVFFGENVVIDKAFPWLIKIGDNCTLTEGVVILSHDASIKKHLGYTKIKPVSIGNNTFVGARSIILPGVNIGNNVIIGAGSVVTKNIPDNCLAVGNPAFVVCSIEDYLLKHKKNIQSSHVYKSGWTLDTGISNSNKEIMKKDVQDRIGYVL